MVQLYILYQKKKSTHLALSVSCKKQATLSDPCLPLKEAKVMQSQREDAIRDCWKCHCESEGGVQTSWKVERVRDKAVLVNAGDFNVRR